MRVSISKVKDVEVRVGGVVEGQVGAGGAEGHIVGVEVVWSMAGAGGGVCWKGLPKN